MSNLKDNTRFSFYTTALTKKVENKKKRNDKKEEWQIGLNFKLLVVCQNMQTI